MFELSIRVKDSETSLVEKMLIYDEDIKFSRDDAKLKQIVIDAVGKFISATSSQEENIDIVLKSKLIWQ